MAMNIQEWKRIEYMNKALTEDTNYSLEIQYKHDFSELWRLGPNYIIPNYYKCIVLNYGTKFPVCQILTNRKSVPNFP